MALVVQCSLNDLHKWFGVSKPLISKAIKAGIALTMSEGSAYTLTINGGKEKVGNLNIKPNIVALVCQGKLGPSSKTSYKLALEKAIETALAGMPSVQAVEATPAVAWDTEAKTTLLTSYGVDTSKQPYNLVQGEPVDAGIDTEVTVTSVDSLIQPVKKLKNSVVSKKPVALSPSAEGTVKGVVEESAPVSAGGVSIKGTVEISKTKKQLSSCTNVGDLAFGSTSSSTYVCGIVAEGINVGFRFVAGKLSVRFAGVKLNSYLTKLAENLGASQGMAKGEVYASVHYAVPVDNDTQVSAIVGKVIGAVAYVIGFQNIKAVCPSPGIIKGHSV